MLQRRAGRSGSLEHPRYAISRHLPFVKKCQEANEVSTVELSMCSYGEQYRKDTCLFTVGSCQLAQLGRLCSGGHDLVRLQGGTRASKAGAYPALLCDEWSALVSASRAACSDFPPAERRTTHEPSSRPGSTRCYGVSPSARSVDAAGSGTDTSTCSSWPCRGKSLIGLTPPSGILETSAFLKALTAW